MELLNKLKDPRTNWEYILIVVILGIIVGAGILVYSDIVIKNIISLSQFIEIKNLEKTVEEKTADWNIYRNEEYGFEVRYPNNWDVKGFPQANVPTFSSAQFPGVKIEIIKPELDGLPSAELLEQAIPRIGIIRQGEKNMEINGLKARQWNTDSPGIVSFIKKEEGSIFQIELYYSDSPGVRNIYNQMLFTFRFFR
jgi:hypothetical protein